MMNPDDTVNQDPEQKDLNVPGEPMTDPMEPADDIFNPLVDEERLPEDYEPPAAAPDDVSKTIPTTHPDTDTDVDPHEVYDAGLSTVADAPRNSGNDDDLREAREIAPLEPEDEVDGAA